MSVVLLPESFWGTTPSALVWRLDNLRQSLPLQTLAAECSVFRIVVSNWKSLRFANKQVQTIKYRLRQSWHTFVGIQIVLTARRT
jgi:hypothetical protein